MKKTPRNIITQFKVWAFMIPSLNSIAFKTYPWQGIISWSGILDSSSCWYAGPTMPPSLLRGEGGVLLKAFLWSIPLLCPGLQQEERFLLGWKKTNRLILARTFHVAAPTSQTLPFHSRYSNSRLGFPSMTVEYLLGGDRKSLNPFTLVGTETKRSSHVSGFLVWSTMY